MTHSSLTPKTAYVAVLACLTVATFGCFGEFDQASEGDQAAQTLSAKKTESWTPPGLDAQGKLAGPWNAADPMASATMAYEWHGFDLESGSVYESLPGDPFAPEVDFYLAYNADTDVHVRVVQEYPASIAMLEGLKADDVGCEHLQGLGSTQDVIDEPVYPDDTMIIVTADGNTFKIGNVVEHDAQTVTFDYQQMNCDE